MKLSELMEALQPNPYYLGVEIEFDDLYMNRHRLTIKDIKIKNTNDGRKVVIIEE